MASSRLSKQLGIPTDKIYVIENWAPIDELPLRPRANEWARQHGLVDKRVVLYSGTLGLKHDPGAIVQLARHFSNQDDVEVVVVSEGRGADWLRRRREEERLSNLRLLPFQPYADLPDVLASGDVLLTLLEADAGAFSVPSKVLSYLCAGRALLAAVPSDNLAAEVVRRSGGGVLVEPGDEGDPRRRRDAPPRGRRPARRSSAVGRAGTPRRTSTSPASATSSRRFSIRWRGEGRNETTMRQQRRSEVRG